MPDVFPHETAVAWTRQYLKKYPLAKGKGLDTMERELADRLDECKKHINAAYDVGDLCSSYTRRMEDPPRNLIHRPPQWIVRGPQGRAALCRWLARAGDCMHRRPPCRGGKKPPAGLCIDLRRTGARCREGGAPEPLRVSGRARGSIFQGYARVMRAENVAPSLWRFSRVK